VKERKGKGRHGPVFVYHASSARVHKGTTFKEERRRRKEKRGLVRRERNQKNSQEEKNTGQSVLKNTQ
jgi:hypothetical protein